MKYLSTVLLLIMMSVSMVFAGVVKGIIKDAESKEPLIGANLVLVGTTMGASTDEDGFFILRGVPAGQYTLEVSYLGYQQFEQTVTVGDGPVNLELELTPVSLVSQAIDIVANRAKIRETPVAFTNVDKEEIVTKLGSRDIPLVLNTTPGIYATDQGGGSGDSRINVRGFDQRNTAVLINGVPVNDMENGWVYWSNWDGLGDVTSSIQVQRGLGASNLAIASVGGTLNILTDPASARSGISYKQEFGSGNFLKETLAANTGLMDNGLAITGALVRKTGNGVVDQTWTDAWAYFAAISYAVNKKHTLELYAIGAPQKHGHRLYEQTIQTFDAEYAREVFENDENIPGSIIDSLVSSGANYGRNYNPNWGPIRNFDPNDLTEYYRGSTHEFSDRSVYMDGEKIDGYSALMERENYYHKPQFNLNWYWNISPKAILTNVAYVSFGRGGGTGLKGWPGVISDGEFAGQLNFQNAYEFNKSNLQTKFGVTGNQSTVVVRNSVNLHNWYGIISTLDYRLSPGMKLTAGIDLRSYKGEHFREVRNLLGGDYYLDFDNANQETPVKRLGEKIDYHNDGFTRWAGGYAQLEGRKDNLTYVLTGSVSQTGYKRKDYFVDPDAHLTNPRILPTESDWETFLGGTAKVGINYNFSPKTNVYGNFGVISKAPIFDAVFDFSHQVYEQTFNEKIYAVELGTGHRLGRSNTNLNLYFTRWNDRSWSRSVNTNGAPVYFLLQGIDARHMGIELDYFLKANQYFDLKAMVSIGDWEWLNNVETTFAPEDDPTNLSSFNVFAKGLKVGDAAQKTFSLSPTVYPTRGLFINATLTGFFDHYADFDPADRTDPNDTAQSWKIPSYALLDLHFGYTLPFNLLNSVKMQLFGHVFNLLDANYIPDAVDNGNRRRVTSHTAESATVYFGLQRRINVGLKLDL